MISLLVIFVSYVNADSVVFSKAPPRSDEPGLGVEHLILTTPQQRMVRAVLATVSSPVGFVHVFPSSPEGCTSRVKTSEIAVARGCLYAVNGGSFDMSTGACNGNLISNGTVFQTDDENAYGSWGLTRDGQWAFGDIGSEIVTNADVVELVSGFVNLSTPNLLVVDGIGVPSTHALVAARTAVGVDRAGRLMLLTVDGLEDSSTYRGMNLTELGVAFAALGAVTALNLDGGGSTVAWMNGSFVDRPTCEDTVFPECERAVASIVCVMPGM
jgi:N-acetylglucosamine-1-phosphodiester alpha-N-acetylglucosaminidase